MSPLFCENSNFIPVYTTARHLPQSNPRPLNIGLVAGIVLLQTIPKYMTSLRICHLSPPICHLSHIPLFFLSELRIIISSYLHSYPSKQDFSLYHPFSG